jgi:predicted nucleotidyltransferase
MQFGLTPKQLAILHSIFAKYLTQGKVVVYGSRVKGNYSQCSDIDLVIQNVAKCDQDLLAQLIEAIDESDFPYLCDLQYFAAINNQQLIEHIKRRGQVLYEK